MKIHKDLLYSYIQLSSFLGNDFCSPNFFGFSRVSESTGKSRGLARKNVWGGSLSFFRWVAGGRIDWSYRCWISLRVCRNRWGVLSHRRNRGCDVVVGSTATIRVFARFWVRKTKETGRVSLSASELAHGTNASPVRLRAAALVSAPHACSQLGSIKPRGSAWRLNWSARKLGLAARYHYNISIPRFSVLSKPFLPLVLPSEVNMVPNRQRQILLGVYFDK